MVKQTTTQGEHTAEQVADIVDRSPSLICMFANDGRIEHKKFGRMYVITEMGLKQTREIIKNSKPGPKGPRKKTGGRTVPPKDLIQNCRTYVIQSMKTIDMTHLVSTLTTQ